MVRWLGKSAAISPKHYLKPVHDLSNHHTTHSSGCHLTTSTKIFTMSFTSPLLLIHLSNLFIKHNKNHLSQVSVPACWSLRKVTLSLGRPGPGDFPTLTRVGRPNIFSTNFQRHARLADKPLSGIRCHLFQTPGNRCHQETAPRKLHHTVFLSAWPLTSGTSG